MRATVAVLRPKPTGDDTARMRRHETRQQRRARERAAAKRGTPSSALDTLRSLFASDKKRRRRGILLVAVALALPMSALSENNSRQRELVNDAVQRDGYTMVSATDTETSVFAWKSDCRKTDKWQATLRTLDGQELTAIVCVGLFRASVLNVN